MPMVFMAAMAAAAERPERKLVEMAQSGPCMEKCPMAMMSKAAMVRTGVLASPKTRKPKDIMKQHGMMWANGARRRSERMPLAIMAKTPSRFMAAMTKPTRVMLKPVTFCRMAGAEKA